MNDLLFATVLALAWFATVNAAASVAAAALGWVLDRTLTTVRPASAARVFFVVRLLPGVASLFFTIALFLPAHWRLEPTNADESAGYSLVLLAAVGAAILVATAWRAWVAARATGWIGRVWARRSQPRAIDAGGVPVYGLPDTSPIVSLVGVFRPRLFVATQVLDALTADELDVSVAHELAHLRSRDNLKRVLVACSPDSAGRARGIRRQSMRQRRCGLRRGDGPGSPSGPGRVRPASPGPCLDEVRPAGRGPGT